MSGRGEDGDSMRTWIRGALVVVVIAAALGVFGVQESANRPRLNALNILGIFVMLAGLFVTIMANTLAERAPEDKRVALGRAIKLGGVTVCVAGAIMVFI